MEIDGERRGEGERVEEESEKPLVSPYHVLAPNSFGSEEPERTV